MLLEWWISKTEGKKIRSFLANINQKDLTYVKELFESNEVKPVIARRYPLSEAAEALRYLGEGHARGKIVITLNDQAAAAPVKIEPGGPRHDHNPAH